MAFLFNVIGGIAAMAAPAYLLKSLTGYVVSKVELGEGTPGQRELLDFLKKEGYLAHAKDVVIANKIALPTSPLQFQYADKNFWIQCEVNASGDSMNITSYVYTVGDSEPTRRMLDELVLQAKKEFTRIYYIKDIYSCEWRISVQRPRRKLDSVILPHRTMQKITQHLQNFLSEEYKKKIEDISEPYCQGYLLYGPPGTGKSSTVSAIAGQLGYDVALLQLKTEDLDESKLIRLINNAPEQSIVLIEDIESNLDNPQVTETGGRVYHTRGTGIGHAGLLEMLAGASITDGRIFFVTTNERPVLSEQIQRRLKAFEIPLPDEHQVSRYLQMRYQDDPECSTILVDECITKLQPLWQRNQRQYVFAISYLRQFLEGSPRRSRSIRVASKDLLIFVAEMRLKHNLFREATTDNALV